MVSEFAEQIFFTISGDKSFRVTDNSFLSKLLVEFRQNLTCILTTF